MAFYFHEGSKNTDKPMFIHMPFDSTTVPMFFHEKKQAEWFYEHGIPEKKLILWTIENLIDKNKIFLDIGSHVGTYTMLCAPHAKHTYSFECSPKTFCFLAANIALHDLTSKVTPIQIALSDNIGSANYILRAPDQGGNGIIPIYNDDNIKDKLLVQTRTLDSYELNNIGLIKIDVEGNEKNILIGAKDTINRCKPKILFESWDSSRGDIQGKLRNDLFDYIKSLNYNIIALTGCTEMFLASPN